MAKSKINQVTRASRARDDSAARRELDVKGLNYVVVDGITILHQGFACSDDPQDLVLQCSDLNRQAVMPPPETLAGKSLREIAASRGA